MAFFNPKILQEALASERHLLCYALAGAVVGIITSLVITLFRLSFELPAQWFLSLEDAQSFESLSGLWHFFLPIGGAFLLASLYHLLQLHDVRVGLPYAVYVVNKGHSLFPFKNTLTQFFGASIALGSGHSVGLEGPAVHLGAASACHAGNKLHVPRQSLRIFAGCGVAAAIAAAFNTPLAGVVFAMEVVLLEYTISGFAPVIMAAVSATTVHKLFNTGASHEIVSHSGTLALQDNFWITLMALTIACMSAGFVRTTKWFLRFSQYSHWTRFLSAGLLTGTLAFFVPQILGTGADTIKTLFLTHIGLSTLLFILIAKLIASSAAIASGIPGGLIGPSLMLGACLGAMFAAVASIFDPSVSANTPVYVLLGMAGMMSAAINAPLAAIIFIVELSFMPGLVFPGLLMVLLSNITHRSIFKLPSIVQLIFEHQGLDISNSSVQKTLAKRSVMQLLQKDFLEIADLGNIPNSTAQKFLLYKDGENYSVATVEKDGSINLTWHAAAEIATTSTALQAWQQLKDERCEYLVCLRKTQKETMAIGILSRKRLIDFAIG